MATKYKILESNFDNKIYSIQSEGICGLLTSETEASPIMRRHETNRAMSATDPENRKKCVVSYLKHCLNPKLNSRQPFELQEQEAKR